MRYFEIDTIAFETKQGKNIPIKDKRDIEEESISFELEMSDDFSIDEVASRKDVYGDDAEDQSYRIYDANIISIIESGYDLSQIRKIGIPL